MSEYSTDDYQVAEVKCRMKGGEVVWSTKDWNNPNAPKSKIEQKFPEEAENLRKAFDRSKAYLIQFHSIDKRYNFFVSVGCMKPSYAKDRDTN